MSDLFLGNVDEVHDPIVAHDSQPVIFLVKGNTLQLVFYFDLRQRQIFREVVAHRLQEAQLRLRILAFRILGGVAHTEAVLLQLDALFD